MEDLMKTEWLSIINKKRNGSYPEWTDEPVVLKEDTNEKVFDIVDTKNLGNPIVRTQGTGHATYFNGDDNAIWLRASWRHIRTCQIHCLCQIINRIKRL